MVATSSNGNPNRTTTTRAPRRRRACAPRSAALDGRRRTGALATLCLGLLTLLAVACGDDAPPADDGPQRCNGHEELCDRPFNEVVFAMTHNSMSNAQERWLAPNQNLPIERQLEDGIRGLMLDTYEERGQLLLCHSFCSIGSRDLVDALTGIRQFLDDNPDEVIAIIFQDAITSAQTEQAFEDSGLIRYVYTHDPDAGWPTLRQMIADDTRVFSSAESRGPPPAWYHHAWDLVQDNPYTYRFVEDFSCTRNRGGASNPLMLVNHWLQRPLPMPEYAEEANEYEVLMEHVLRCEEERGQRVNFVGIDFHDIGDVLEVVDVLNGVREPRP